MSPLKEFRSIWLYRVAAIAVLLFFGFSRPGIDFLKSAEIGVTTLLSPVANSFNTGLNYLYEGTSSVIHVRSLSTENKKMKQELAVLREENRNLQDIVNRSTFLSNAEAIRRNRKDKPVEARVTAKSSGMYFSRFSINKGSKAGISVGDTVVSAMRKGNDASVEGVVGYVTDVGAYTAKVRSIIDEDTAISFRSIRTSDGGVLRGVNRNLEGYAFDLNADLVVGDTLFTTGAGDYFAPDLYIGDVSEVSTDEDKMVKNIKVKSAINFHKIYDVFVLTGAR